MGKLRSIWANMFDIRAGEGWRVFYMGLYLFLVLFAYYILKPVSRGMFIFQFDIDEFPYLYILIAGAGGAMAYVYTKIAVHASLKKAVQWCTLFMAGTLVLIWHLLSFNWPWVLYAFNVFVSLFAITLPTQGWLVASNVFTTREAKRVYGVLGLGAVIGAAFGGTFTSMLVHVIGTRHLLLASVVFVGLAYLAFPGAIRQPGVNIEGAKAAEDEEEFSIKDITQGISRHHHLQVIIAIIMLTYIVDVTVEFQFNAMVKGQYDESQREVVAFLGQFFGIYLNFTAFIFQAFLTAFVVGRFGVGGALQVMPVSIGLASVFAFFSPTLLSTAAARLTEAATRYTFNRTGMELLYLPLPSDLRNRTKAFTDIFVDRFSRGLGGLLLILFTKLLGLTVQQLALVVIVYTAVWIVLSIRAQREYVSTVRKRLDLRRLDLEALRVNLNEAATIKLLETTAQSDNPRQATYALSLLAEARGYRFEDRLGHLVGSKLPEVRGKIFEAARERKSPALYEQALAELRSARFGDETAVVKPAVDYALAMSPDPRDLAKRLITHPNRSVAQSAVEALVMHPEAAQELITSQWVAENASAPDPGRRALAAIGIRLRRDGDAATLHKLLADPDPNVASAACTTASELKDRAYLDSLLRLLSRAQMRGRAIETLAAYGERIVGTLGDVLLDTTMPLSVRRHVPRVLRNIPGQRSVDVLLQALGEQDLTVRSSVLKALNGLRENNPKLNYGRESVMQHILSEARYYYEMSAALSALEDRKEQTTARLLIDTLQERLSGTLDRVFRLLGLRYPPKEMRAAYLAVNRKKSDEHTAALEFLDNVLERELKRVILPLLDEGNRREQAGREVFGIDTKDARMALRELLRSGDSWLVACAIATAAELGATELRPDIEPLSRSAGREVGLVAQSALATLAG